MSTDWFVDINLIHTGRTAITKRPDGTALETGDIWNDMTNCEMRRWTGSTWSSNLNTPALFIGGRTSSQTVTTAAGSGLLMNNFIVQQNITGVNNNSIVNILIAGRYRQDFSVSVYNTGAVDTLFTVIMLGTIAGNTYAYEERVTVAPGKTESIYLTGIFDWTVGAQNTAFMTTSAANVDITIPELFITKLY